MRNQYRSQTLQSSRIIAAFAARSARSLPAMEQSPAECRASSSHILWPPPECPVQGCSAAPVLGPDLSPTPPCYVVQHQLMWALDVQVHRGHRTCLPRPPLPRRAGCPCGAPAWQWPGSSWGRHCSTTTPWGASPHAGASPSLLGTPMQVRGAMHGTAGAVQSAIARGGWLCTWHALDGVMAASAAVRALAWHDSPWWHVVKSQGSPRRAAEPATSCDSASVQAFLQG